jgi:8-amino-3,8-dideoxy-alpha-D-manno-octulosonate transaminase
MKEKGILAGSFYWYDNNWHYIRRWDHLKKGLTMGALHPEHRQAVLFHANKDFSASDRVMGRCISTAISLLWTEDQIRAKGEQMKAAILEVMEKVSA